MTIAVCIEIGGEEQVVSTYISPLFFNSDKNATILGVAIQFFTFWTAPEQRVVKSVYSTLVIEKLAWVLNGLWNVLKPFGPAPIFNC